MVQEVPVRGASTSKNTVAGVWDGWLKHHRSSCSSSFFRLLSTPLQTLMTSMVVAIAIALPATLLTFLENFQEVGQRWDSKPKLSAFLHIKSSPEAIYGLQQSLLKDIAIEEIDYLSPEQALLQFQARSGFSDVLSILDENPLPPTLVITPTEQHSGAESVLQLQQRLVQQALVDEVDVDLDWVRRLRAYMALGEQIVVGLAILLGLGVLLAIGNTIRLAIEGRREEIIIIKLVGGTNRFVRRPFLYTGALYGLFGGVMACILITVGFIFLSGSVERLSLSYSSDFRLAGLGFLDALGLLLVSVLLGLMGAWLAVGRHLHDIEPS